MRASSFVPAGALLLLAGLLCGCNEHNLDMHLYVTSPLAVGARGLISPRDACTRTGGKLGLECTKEVPRIVSYELEPEGILEVEAEIDSEFTSGLRVRAVGEGTVSVTLVAENGLTVQTLTGEVRALAADRLTLVPVAYAFDGEANEWSAAPLPCEAPLLLGAGATVRFSYALFAGDEPLGADDLCPVSSDAFEGEVGCGVPAAGLLTARIGAAPGEASLRTPVDAGWSVPVRVFEASEVDGVALTEAFRLVRREHLWAPALVGGRGACADTLARIISTPEDGPCQVLRRMPGDPASPWTGPGPYELYRTGSALCVVSAVLEGTGFTAEAEYAR